MHPLALLLLTPKTIRLAPLFGQTRAVVERSLGSGKPILSDILGGVARQRAQHGEVEVEYLNGRARAITRTFPRVPEMNWQAAMELSGYASKEITAENNGKRQLAGVWINDWRLKGGPIDRDYAAVFTRRRIGTQTTVQALAIEAPHALVVTPSPSERKAILDGLRPSVEKAFHGQRVKFVVHMIAAANDWAFLTTTPIAAVGGKLDLKNSDFAAAAESGIAGDSAYALLQKVAGVWRPIETALLPTDVAWETWSDKHLAPRIIFPDFASPHP